MCDSSRSSPSMIWSSGLTRTETTSIPSFAIFWIYIPAWILKLPFVQTSLAHQISWEAKRSTCKVDESLSYPKVLKRPRVVFSWLEILLLAISPSPNWTEPSHIDGRNPKAGIPRPTTFWMYKILQNDGITYQLPTSTGEFTAFLVAINSSAKDIFVVPCWEVTKVTGLQLGEQGSSDRHLHDRMPRDAWWKWQIRGQNGQKEGGKHLKDHNHIHLLKWCSLSCQLRRCKYTS